MNRFPPEPLDDEERALAALIAREGPYGEPSPSLDAKILAAAHSATGGPAKRKPRWPIFTGAAASVLLAAGIGWQMLSERDQAAVLSNAPAAAPAASTAMVEPRQAEVAAAREIPPSPPAPPSPRAGAETKLRPPPSPTSSKPAPASDAAMQESVGVAAAEPAFAPPPPAVVEAPASAPRKAMRAENAASARSAAPAMQSAPAPASVEAAAMADDISLHGIPVEDDARLPESEWLQRIERRLAQGDRDGARDSLRRFAGKYPQADLSPELRALLDE